jgi:hypothetical protein
MPNSIPMASRDRLVVLKPRPGSRISMADFAYAISAYSPSSKRFIIQPSLEYITVQSDGSLVYSIPHLLPRIAIVAPLHSKEVTLDVSNQNFVPGPYRLSFDSLELAAITGLTVDAVMGHVEVTFTLH